MTIKYAGFWRRFLSFIIDNIILFIVNGIIGIIINIITVFLLTYLERSPQNILMVSTIMGFVNGIIINWLYFTMFESSYLQATPGKIAIGIIVSDYERQQISFARANARYWGKIISSVILMAGFIMAAFTNKKQALHDIMTGCLVIKKY